MTAKDSILLREANAACYLEWSEVYDLAEQAESREVREEILARGRFLRHLDREVREEILARGRFLRHLDEAVHDTI